MKAVVIREKKFFIEERAIPVSCPGHVRVKIHTCGLSRDDLPMMEAGEDYIVGRGIVGTVDMADTHFQNLVGKRVVVLPAQPCGCCHYCRTNRKSLCDDLVLLGAADGIPGHGTQDGGAAEYILAQGSRVLPVEDELSDGELSCVHDFAMALAAARKAELLYAEEAAVIGNGSWCLALVDVLKSMGCLRVYCVDSDREIMGGISISGKTVPEGVRIRTVFDTVCTTESQRMAIGLTCEKGSVVGLARIQCEVPYILRDFNGERSIQTVAGPEDSDYYDVLKMLEAGRLNANPLLGAAFELEDAPTALQSLRAGGVRVRLIVEPEKV